jgi:hypothetical protein
MNTVTESFDAMSARVYANAETYALTIKDHAPGAPSDVLCGFFGDGWHVVSELECPEWTPQGRKPNVVILTNGVFWSCSRMWWRKRGERWDEVPAESRAVSGRSAIHNGTVYADGRAALVTALCEVVRDQTLGSMTSCWVLATQYLIATCPVEERASVDAALWVARLNAPELPVLLDAMYNSRVGSRS